MSELLQFYLEREALRFTMMYLEELKLLDCGDTRRAVQPAVDFLKDILSTLDSR